MLILKRSRDLKQVLFFTFLVLLFQYAYLSLEGGASVFDANRFMLFLKTNWWLVCLFVASFLSIYFLRKVSKPLFAIFLGIIFVWNFSIFFRDFNKPLMLLTFIFFLISFYFLIVLQFELKEAVNNPNYNLSDMEVHSLYPFRAFLESGEYMEGVLTNWDSKGCFFVPLEKKKISPGRVSLKIEFEKKIFFQKGQAVCSFGKGIGIRFNFEKESGNLLNWNDFYNILDDRGFHPKG